MRLVPGRVVENGVARLAGLQRPRMPPVALPPLVLCVTRQGSFLATMSKD
jgi:hypothetical protein